MDYLKLHYPLLASAVFVLTILVAHLFASGGYNWTNHTISHLGAQAYENKWIMQTGFILFGLIILLGTLLNGISLRTTPVLLYGLCVALTGIFCTQPFFEVANYDIQQDKLHSTFAQVAGIAFSIGILVQVFYSSEKKLKLIHLAFFVGVIGVSALFGLLKSNQGIAQRLLYLISLYWLSFWYEP